MNQPSPLPILTDVAYANALIARKAVALRDGTPERPMPDCIVIRTHSPMAKNPNGKVYDVYIGDCSTRRDSLDDAIAYARDVMTPMTAEQALHDFLRSVAGAAA